MLLCPNCKKHTLLPTGHESRIIGPNATIWSCPCGFEETLTIFDRRWVALVKEGWCKASQYERILKEWIVAGEPPIDEFIKQRAND